MADRVSDFLAQEGVLWSTAKGREKVIQNAAMVRNAITTNLDMCEKAIPILKGFLTTCISRVYKDTDVEKLKPTVQKFKDDTIALDYNRGTEQEMRKESMAFLKLRMNKIFNRADMGHKDVRPDVAALMQDCSAEGSLGSRYKPLADQYAKLIDDAVAARDRFISAPINVEMLSILAAEIKFFGDQLALTEADMGIMRNKFKKAKYTAFESDFSRDFCRNHEAISYAMNLAMEADIDSSDVEEVSAPGKLVKARLKISSGFKSLLAKLKTLFERFKKEEEDPAYEEPAAELFGFNKGPKKYAGNDAMTAVADYLAKNLDSVEKNLPKGNYLFKDGCDPLIHNMTLSMKEFCWEQNIPLATIAIQKAGRKERVFIGILSKSFQGNPKDITMVGILTVDLDNDTTVEGIREMLSKGSTISVSASLTFFPLWSIEEPEYIGPPKRVVILTSGEMQYSPSSN